MPDYIATKYISDDCAIQTKNFGQDRVAAKRWACANSDDTFFVIVIWYFADSGSAGQYGIW